MTYALPPLNALRAFEAAARHLSFKLAAHELHVTPAAVGQQVKALEARLGVPLFERLHKQLILTAAGQAYLPGISEGFRHIAEATSQLKPAGAMQLQLGVHGSFDLRRLDLAAFRSTHAEIGLRVLQPAGTVQYNILLMYIPDGSVELSSRQIQIRIALENFRAGLSVPNRHNPVHRAGQGHIMGNNNNGYS